VTPTYTYVYALTRFTLLALLLYIPTVTPTHTYVYVCMYAGMRQQVVRVRRSSKASSSKASKVYVCMHAGMRQQVVRVRRQRLVLREEVYVCPHTFVKSYIYVSSYLREELFVCVSSYLCKEVYICVLIPL
jgi:hypothetical protein